MLGMDLGLSRFKFFPAEANGGIPALKAIAAPFGARFCPTGGITLATAPNYLALEAVLCVGGSWMLPKSVLTAPRSIRPRLLPAPAPLRLSKPKPHRA
jgi:2-dehydro-3-deoxyphosphogluconate aldolase/(4S)-4-hydroxy-2-oxoglutarate aldolase